MIPSPRSLLLIATVLAVAACAPKSPRTSESIITAAAVVESVNQDARQVTLRDAATGESFSVVAGPEVRNLPQLAAGDTVALDFYQATTISMAAAGTVPETTGAVAAARAPEGATPGALVVTTTNTTVRVISYNENSGFATFTTPDGVIHRATVPPELRSFAAQRKRGDLVDVTFTDAFAISIVEQES